MAKNLTDMLAYVDTNVTTNGVGDITGAILNDVMKNSINTSVFAPVSVVSVTTDLTIDATYSGKLIICDSVSLITITVPNDLEAGTIFSVLQKGTGDVTFTGATGATLNNASSQFTIAGQHTLVSVLTMSNSSGTNADYVLIGNTK